MRAQHGEEGVGVAGGSWEFDEKLAQAAVEAIGAAWK